MPTFYDVLIGMGMVGIGILCFGLLYTYFHNDDDFWGGAA